MFMARKWPGEGKKLKVSEKSGNFIFAYAGFHTRWENPQVCNSWVPALFFPLDQEATYNSAY